MPCHPGYKISENAVEYEHAIILPQAKNRKHIQKTIFSLAS